MKRLSLACLMLGFLLLTPSHAFSEEIDWRQEYDRICAHKADAEQLTSAQLAKLIEEADRLLEVIKVQEDPDAKLYLIKLRQCRGFFVFMKETQDGAE